MWNKSSRPGNTSVISGGWVGFLRNVDYTVKSIGGVLGSLICSSIANSLSVCCDLLVEILPTGVHGHPCRVVLW